MPLPAQELARLANEVDLITVRSTHRGPAVFTDEITKQVIVWGDAGDPAGEDVKQCPSSLLKNPQFLSCIAKGILVVEDAPEVLQDALDAQKKDWDARQQRAAEAGMLAQRQADKIVGRGVACIAPVRGGEVCGNYALAMGSNPREKPPLCGEHAHLVNHYVLSETGNIDADGKTEVVWKRATLTR